MFPESAIRNITLKLCLVSNLLEGQIEETYLIVLTARECL